MAELKWEHGDGEHDAGHHMIFEGPNALHGVQYTLTVGLETLDEAYRFAQRIENVLDPPECPVGHGSTFEFYRRQLTLVMGDRGEPEVGEEVVLIEPKFCPDCGQPLTKES